MEALPATRKQLESAQSAAYKAHCVKIGKQQDWAYKFESFWPKHESVEEIVHFEGGDFTKPLTFADTKIGKTYIIIYNGYPLKVGTERCRDKYQIHTRKDASLDGRRPCGVCVDHWYEGMWDWPYMGNFWGKDACVFFEKV
jgi:hypothetical protein